MSRAIETPDTPKDGGPAFPVNPYKGEVYREAMGMTLRDWFAGQALAGWLASFGSGESARPDGCAEFAYEMADAMLAERGSQS